MVLDRRERLHRPAENPWPVQVGYRVSYVEHDGDEPVTHYRS